MTKERVDTHLDIFLVKAALGCRPQRGHVSLWLDEMNVESGPRLPASTWICSLHLDEMIADCQCCEAEIGEDVQLSRWGPGGEAQASETEIDPVSRLVPPRSRSTTWCVMLPHARAKEAAGEVDGTVTTSGDKLLESTYAGRSGAENSTHGPDGWKASPSGDGRIAHSGAARSTAASCGTTPGREGSRPGGVRFCAIEDQALGKAGGDRLGHQPASCWRPAFRPVHGLRALGSEARRF